MMDLWFRNKPRKLLHHFRPATAQRAGGGLVGNEKDGELKHLDFLSFLRDRFVSWCLGGEKKK